MAQGEIVFDFVYTFEYTVIMTDAEKKKRELLDSSMLIRVTESEKKLFEAAAIQERKATTKWMRDVCTKAAKKVIK